MAGTGRVAERSQRSFVLAPRAEAERAHGGVPDDCVVVAGVERRLPERSLDGGNLGNDLLPLFVVSHSIFASRERCSLLSPVSGAAAGRLPHTRSRCSVTSYTAL